jgi:hypothetical protein
MKYYRYVLIILHYNKTENNMKMTAFWDIEPYRLIEVY